MAGNTLPIALALVALVAAVVALGLWAHGLRARTARLESELREVRDQLAQTERLRALGEMAGSFAHSFNEILTPIVGRTQLLAQRLTDRELCGWVEAIERAAFEGAQIVRRIQDFIRVRRDRDPVTVDLNRAVEAAVAATASRRPSTVTVLVSLGNVPRVAGDPLALREALGHVLTNAADAMPAGGALTVSTDVQEGDAVVVVTDTGNGMSPDIHRRAFEPFFTTKSGSIGLGLSVAYGVVARHGGHIDVESAPGQGTTVRLRFPAEALTTPAAPGARAAQPAGPARVLLVDDDAFVREMLRDMLGMRGHQVVMASDGADGVDRFKAGQFDLVITDLAMPKLNGLQLARVCKSLRPSVPVLMVTGWGVLLSDQELTEHGVDGVLGKPFRSEEIFAAVAAVRSRVAATEGKA